MKELDIIERYFAGRLSAKELGIFKTRLKQEEALQKEVTSYQSILEGFRALRIQNLEKQFQELESDLQSNNPNAWNEVEWIEGNIAAKSKGLATKSFDALVLADEDFAKRVKDYEVIFGGMESLRVQNLTDKFKAFEESPQTSTNSPNPTINTNKGQEAKIIDFSKWKRKLMAAASVVILFGVGCSFWHANEHYSNEVLIGDYYNVLITDDTEKGAADQTNPLEALEKGKDLVDDGNYQEAIAFFNGFGDEDRLYLVAQCYLGEIYKMQEDYANATIHFRNILKVMDDGKKDNYFFDSTEIRNVELNIVLMLIGQKADKNVISQYINRIFDYKADNGGKHPYYKETLELNERLKSKFRMLCFN